MQEKITKILEKNALTGQMVHDRRYRTVVFAVLSLIGNLLYAFYHGVLGLMTRSPWFLASGIYYALLTAIRFSAVVQPRKAAQGNWLMGFTGTLLSILSLVLGGILFMSLRSDTATAYGEITMITIAAYTFAKLTTAIIRVVKNQGDWSPQLAAIGTTRWAEIAVSIFTMQQSMLVSFGEMDPTDIFIFNLCTGTAVCLFTLFLGILLIHTSGRSK